MVLLMWKIFKITPHFLFFKDRTMNVFHLLGLGHPLLWKNQK